MTGATCGGRKCSLFPEHLISPPLDNSYNYFTVYEALPSNCAAIDSIKRGCAIMMSLYHADAANDKYTARQTDAGYNGSYMAGIQDLIHTKCRNARY